MKRLIPIFFLFICFSILLSCNSNSLKQVNAERTINEFLVNNTIKTSNFEVSPSAVRRIGKTNIYSQFHTSVKVDFKSTNKQGFTLLFDFTRTPDNKWFLQSVDVVDRSIQELGNWLETKKSLNIPAQST